MAKLVTGGYEVVSFARSWHGMTQAAAARRLGVTQPRLGDLLRGRINNFSLDALTVLAGHVDPDAAIEGDVVL